MKQRFFTNTLKSSFIKSLIYNTPIPIISSVNDSSYILKDNIYIYKNNIIKCMESGIIKMPEIKDGYTAYYQNGNVRIIPSETAPSANALRISNGILYLPQGTGYFIDPTIDIRLDEPYSVYYNGSDEEIAFTDSTYDNKYDDLLFNYSEVKQGDYRIIDRYDFGKYYPKFTELYYSNYGYYDTKTHEYLGKLLRLYRDIYDINLMPYYNCVSGDYISGIVIYPTEIRREDSSNYKTFKIPIKFNTNYTLALDSSSDVKTVPILLSDNHIIDNITYYNSSGNTESFNPNKDIVSNIKIFSSTSFKQPKLIGINTLNKTNANILQQYEKYLYLLIQLPKSNSSSVVLLEGDYTDIKNKNVYNIEGIEELDDLELSNLMTSDLSLLQMNDGITYPFSDRLIEYLLLNVITTRDPITKNIERIQDLFTNYNGIPEVWNNILRSNVYLEYQRSDMIEHLDLNGFVDIDTERLMKKLG